MYHSKKRKKIWTRCVVFLNNSVPPYWWKLRSLLSFATNVPKQCTLLSCILCLCALLRCLGACTIYTLFSSSMFESTGWSMPLPGGPARPSTYRQLAGKSCYFPRSRKLNNSSSTNFCQISYIIFTKYIIVCLQVYQIRYTAMLTINCWFVEVHM